MIYLLIAAVIVIFFLAYLVYGRFLAHRLKLHDDCPTPACRINDGVDFVPAKKPFYTFLPMVFMLIVTIWSLINFIKPLALSIYQGQNYKFSPYATISGICSIVLLALSFVIVYQAIQAIAQHRKNKA